MKTDRRRPRRQSTRWPAWAPAVLFVVFAVNAQAQEAPLRRCTHSPSSRAIRRRVSLASPCNRIGFRWARWCRGRRPASGRVATQSFVEPSYGPRGLELMRAGQAAPQALAALLAEDAHADVRQVGMIDARGNVASHTGDNAIREHCNITGANFAVQANLMERPTVCTAMAAAFQHAEGDLASRMMAALVAAQGEGGDIRGQQSAALIVGRGARRACRLGAGACSISASRIIPRRSRNSRACSNWPRAYNLMTAGDMPSRRATSPPRARTTMPPWRSRTTITK
ncbi:MAG: DUF1028 domain-containing protein [Terricaulis sp.]